MIETETKQKSQDHEGKNPSSNLCRIVQIIYLLKSIWA